MYASLYILSRLLRPPRPPFRTLSNPFPCAGQEDAQCSEALINLNDTRTSPSFVSQVSQLRASGLDQNCEHGAGGSKGFRPAQLSHTGAHMT